MQAVVAVLVWPPGLRVARGEHALLQLGDVAGGRVERRLAGDLRLDQEARLHHLPRIGSGGDGGDVRIFLGRAGAAAGALVAVAPQLAVASTRCPDLAQLARSAELRGGSDGVRTG